MSASEAEETASLQAGHEVEITEENGSSSGQDQENGGKPMTMEERKAKLAKLKQKFVSTVLYCLYLSTKRPSVLPLRANRYFQAASSRENRQSLIEETTKARLTARETARLERQRKLAETLRLKVESEERGEDIERAKNWEWTIEENEEWEKKLARKKRRADYEFHGQPFASIRLVPNWILTRKQTTPMLRGGDTRKI